MYCFEVMVREYVAKGAAAALAKARARFLAYREFTEPTVC